MMEIAAIILAAGRGRRAGMGLPKTYRMLDGSPVLRHSIECFLSHPKITKLQAVIHTDDIELYQEAVSGLTLRPPVFGGETRAASVVEGMKAIKTDLVLIHDGARPFIDHALIDRIIDALEDADGAIPALPVTDALWQVDGQSLKRPQPRENLVRAQTPQGFHYRAYAPIALGGEARDDAEAAIAAGLDVQWVEGSSDNIKLTFAEDFE